MTDTLRTRIARVICDASWQHGRGLTIGQAESVAASVLVEMREPTDPMHDAGWHSECDGIRAIWRVMVDAAITEDE